MFEEIRCLIITSITKDAEPFWIQDLISNSLYCLLDNSYCVTLEEIGDGLTYNPVMNIFLYYI